MDLTAKLSKPVYNTAVSMWGFFCAIVVWLPIEQGKDLLTTGPHKPSGLNLLEE